LKIAVALGVYIADLQAANPSIDWRRLKVGQVINVPPKHSATEDPSQEPAPASQK